MSENQSSPRKPIHPHGIATGYLTEKDPRLGEHIGRIGPCALPTKPKGEAAVYFRGLCRAIVAQQLSGKAASTIFGRLEALATRDGVLSPARILSLPVEELRGVGLSGSKASFVRDLSERVDGGVLDLDALDGLDDEQAILELTAVKGVGRWTAQMFLMFELARPDIFAPDDLGLKKGMARLIRSRKPLDKARMDKVARRWAPHRSVASWYLWRICEAPED